MEAVVLSVKKRTMLLKGGGGVEVLIVSTSNNIVCGTVNDVNLFHSEWAVNYAYSE